MKQHINDVLLEIPIAADMNAELLFLTNEDVKTFLDNCKTVQLQILIILWQCSKIKHYLTNHLKKYKIMFQTFYVKRMIFYTAVHLTKF